MKMGKATREAKKTEKDPVHTFIRTAGGYKILKERLRDGSEKKEGDSCGET